ncbi:MAG: AMP-binding protein, partial [bacterium]|nr:AMP-binding protein [bacterium]
FISYFRKIVSAVIENPGKPIADLEIITPQEKKRLLYDLNDTKTGYPGDEVIHIRFERQVEKTPGNIALVETITGRRSITYRQLNDNANRLALALISKGVKTDDIIAIMAERSLEMIVGLLAILKAGGAYLPISPGLPTGRKKFMLEDSSAGYLLLQEHLAGENKDLPGNLSKENVLYLDDPRIYRGIYRDEMTHPGPVPNPQVRVQPRHLGYIIYTS